MKKQHGRLCANDGELGSENQNTYDTLILVWEISRNHLIISCSNFKRYVNVKSWKQTQIQAPVTQAKVCQVYSTHKSGLGSRGQHLEFRTIRQKKTKTSVKHLELQNWDIKFELLLCICAHVYKSWTLHMLEFNQDNLYNTNSMLFHPWFIYRCSQVDPFSAPCRLNNTCCRPSNCQSRHLRPWNNKPNANCISNIIAFCLASSLLLVPFEVKFPMGYQLPT